MNACSRFPCGMTTDGYCPTCTPRPVYAPNTYPLPVGAQPWPFPPPGCICPPTSEQTCQSPACPRKDPSRGAPEASR